MTKEELQTELKAHGVKFHHKSGVAKLAELYKAALDPTTPVEVAAPVVKVAPVVKKVPAAVARARDAQDMKISRMSPKERKALALVRIVVVPNDPLLASYPASPSPGSYTRTSCSMRVWLGADPRMELAPADRSRVRTSLSV